MNSDVTTRTNDESDLSAFEQRLEAYLGPSSPAAPGATPCPREGGDAGAEADSISLFTPGTAGTFNGTGTTNPLFDMLFIPNIYGLQGSIFDSRKLRDHRCVELLRNCLALVKPGGWLVTLSPQSCGGLSALEGCFAAAGTTQFTVYDTRVAVGSLFPAKVVAAQRHRKSGFRHVSNRSFVPTPSCWCYRIWKCPTRPVKKQAVLDSGTSTTSMLTDPLLANQASILDGIGGDGAELEYSSPRDRIVSRRYSTRNHASSAAVHDDDGVDDGDDSSSISSIVAPEVSLLLLAAAAACLLAVVF